MTGTLMIRADAGLEMGTGHVMRCLALAQAWQDAGGKAVFALAESTPTIDERLLSEDMDLVKLTSGVGTEEDANETAALAQARQAAWVVVDGYRFGAGYQQRLKAAKLNVLFIDDTGECGPYSAAVVLNQNVQAQEAMYQSREPSTQLLLGPQYALLRREFRPWRGWKLRAPPVARRLLVVMGGSDSDNITLKTIEAIRALRGRELEVTVVVGGSNPHWGTLQRAASISAVMIELRRNSSSMVELMAGADLAISAGGGTCYELAFMEVPTLLVTAARNQAPTCQAMAQCGAAIDLGWFHSLDARELANRLHKIIPDRALRQSLMENARALVDGGGSQRVTGVLLGRSAPGKMPPGQLGTRAG